MFYQDRRIHTTVLMAQTDIFTVQRVVLRAPWLEYLTSKRVFALFSLRLCDFVSINSCANTRTELHALQVGQCGR